MSDVTAKEAEPLMDRADALSVELRILLAQIRDCFPTVQEQEACQQAVMECFDDPVLDPSMRAR